MKMKKILLLLVLLLAVAMATACGGNGDTNGDTPAPTPAAGQEQAPQDQAGNDAPADDWVPGTLPVVTEPTTFTVWHPIDADVTSIMEHLHDSFFWEEMERRTGVRLEFVHPPIGAEQDALSLMIVSGDYPDVLQFFGASYTYPGGIARGIADGVIICVRDLAERYAPNFWAAVHRNEETRRQAFTDEGYLPGFWQVNYIHQPPWFGMATRQDWLDELDLDMPITFDDWHHALTLFRDEIGADAPLMIPSSGFPGFNVFQPAFNTSNTFFQMDGQVVWGPLLPGFRDYIETMHQWFSEGLIDPDFATRTFMAAPMDMKTAERTGLWPDVYVLFPVNESLSQNPDFRSVAAPTPLRYQGQNLHLGLRNAQVGFIWVVTDRNPDPVTFTRFIDYKYSYEGALLANYGIYEKTFVYGPDGIPVFTSHMYDNPNGLSLPQALRWYTKQPSGAVLYDWRRELSGAPQDVVDALEIWERQNDFAWNMPPVTLTADEGSEFARIMSDIDTLRDEMVVRFIIGTEPLDNFDNFIDTVHALNIERAIELQQIALDRFNAR